MVADSTFNQPDVTFSPKLSQTKYQLCNGSLHHVNVRLVTQLCITLYIKMHYMLYQHVVYAAPKYT